MWWYMLLIQAFERQKQEYLFIYSTENFESVKVTKREKEREKETQRNIGL